ncbi:MAG: 30S ribosomal protein S6 [Treponema sp.]|nr:30S ribosomal protein S6 [Treponema sp.]MBR6192684.1 30S ribosomal protein S6 [Treponema sp.]
MRKYELMTIYPIEDDKYKAGIETLRADLSKFGVEIEKEEPFGDRDLTYTVKKQKRGRFVLLHIAANPSKITELDTQFKFNTNLLKYLFVLKEEKSA